VGFALKTKVCPQTTPDKMIEIIKTDFSRYTFYPYFFKHGNQTVWKENMLYF
jgi:hypothetical protein